MTANDDNAIFDCKVMSREHAYLEAPHNSSSMGRVYLKDSSKFGTWVNEHKVPKDALMEVREGDFLSFGHKVVHSSDGVTHEPVRVMVEFLRNGPSIDILESTGPQRLNTFTCPSASSSDNDEGYEPSITGSSYWDDGSDQELAEKDPSNLSITDSSPSQATESSGRNSSKSRPVSVASRLDPYSFDAHEPSGWLPPAWWKGPRGRKLGTPTEVCYSNSERSSSRSSRDFDIAAETALLMEEVMSASPMKVSSEPIWDVGCSNALEPQQPDGQYNCDQDELSHVRGLSPELGSLPWMRGADKPKQAPIPPVEVIDCDTLADPEVCEIEKSQWLSSQHLNTGDLEHTAPVASSSSLPGQPTPHPLDTVHTPLPRLPIDARLPVAPYVDTATEVSQGLDAHEAAQFSSSLSSLQKLKTMRTEIEEALESVKDILPDLPPMPAPTGPVLDPDIIPYDTKMNMIRSLKESAKAYKAVKPMVDEYRSRVAIKDLLNSGTDSNHNEMKADSTKPADLPTSIRPDQLCLKPKAAEPPASITPVPSSLKRKAADITVDDVTDHYDLSRSTQTDQPMTAVPTVTVPASQDEQAVPRSTKRLRTVIQKAASATAFAALGSIATIGFLASPMAERLAGF